MLKESTTIKEVVDLLNDALYIDEKAMVKVRKQGNCP